VVASVNNGGGYASMVCAVAAFCSYHHLAKGPQVLCWPTFITSEWRGKADTRWLDLERWQVSSISTSARFFNCAPTVDQPLRLFLRPPDTVQEFYPY
jgi:hypothetical protein